MTILRDRPQWLESGSADGSLTTTTDDSICTLQLVSFGGTSGHHAMLLVSAEGQSWGEGSLVTQLAVVSIYGALSVYLVPLCTLSRENVVGSSLHLLDSISD